MRIALFSETYLPYINGVVTHVKILKEGLEQLGHQVLVVCADPKIRKYVLKDGVLRCPGVTLKKIYDYGVATPISPIRFRYIKDFNPDVIHIHTEFGVGYSGAAAAKRLGVPLVYTLHTMYDDYLYYIAPQKLIKIAKKSTHAYAKVLATKATCLTGPSKKVEEYFRECGVEKPVYVVPNPVETDLFTPDCIDSVKRKRIRKQFGVRESDFLLCFCGRLGKEKSVDKLLDFWAQEMKQKENCKLLIIGEGPAKEELESQAKVLGIDSQVLFAGKVDHTHLPPYYASCDLYVTASLSDTNSISMLEAMAAGLPVLHIKDELNRGQVISGVNGFIYENAREMKCAIDNYQMMPEEERRALKEASRNSVLSAGAQQLAENLLQVYAEANRKIKEK